MKKLFVLVMSAMMIFAMSTAVFAATENPQSTPVHLTATATALDFSVAENVTITATSGAVKANVSDYTIKNNNDVSFIKVSNVKLEAVVSSGWEKAEYNETAFSGYARNANKFALQAKVEGEEGAPVDLYNDWTTAGNINHGQTMTIKLDGLVTPVTDAITGTQIATLVATVSA